MFVQLLFACVPSGPSVDDELALRMEVLHAVHTEIVAVEYGAFATRASDLEGAAAAFCTAPSEGGIETVRGAWMAARTPWKRMEIVGFGPVVDEPFRFRPLIDFWPVRDTVVDDLLAGGQPLDLEQVQAMGASSRGMPVVEYLLWHPELGQAQAFIDDERRCTYLVSLSADLKGSGEGLLAAWNDYAPLLEDPASQPDFAYLDTQQVLDEWVNRMLFALDNIRAEKLGKPLGDTTQGVALPESVESRYSGRSLQDAMDVFAGVELVFEGREQGFDELMPDARTPVGFFEDFATRRTAAREALRAIPEPLEQAVQSEPASVVAAQDALRELQVMIQVDMAAAMGVALAFNDNDGD